MKKLIQTAIVGTLVAGCSRGSDVQTTPYPAPQSEAPVEPTAGEAPDGLAQPIGGADPWSDLYADMPGETTTGLDPGALPDGVEEQIPDSLPQPGGGAAAVGGGMPVGGMPAGALASFAGMMQGGGAARQQPADGGGGMQMLQSLPSIIQAMASGNPSAMLGVFGQMLGRSQGGIGGQLISQLTPMLGQLFQGGGGGGCE